MLPDALNEIVRTANEDERIKSIIVQLSSMTSEEREDFKRKMMLYFIDKDSDVDVEAFKFFKLLLENLELIAEKLNLKK